MATATATALVRVVALRQPGRQLLDGALGGVAALLLTLRHGLQNVMNLHA